MAAPNLISATTINGKTVGSNLTSTAVTTVLNNPASSGKVLKINTLNLANYNASAVAVSVFYSNGANTSGNANSSIVGSVTVPANATLNVIDKTSQYYLEENTSIGAVAATGYCVSVTASYEDVS